MAQALKDFTHVVEQNPQAWREASQEEREGLIHDWARMRTQDEKGSRDALDGFVNEASEIGKRYLDPTSVPPPSFKKPGVLEGVSRVFGFPRDMLYAAYNQPKPGGVVPSPKEFLERVKYPLSQGFERLRSGKEQPAPTWVKELPGPQGLWDFLIDPWIALPVGKALAKYGGKKLAKRFPKAEGAVPTPPPTPPPSVASPMPPPVVEKGATSLVNLSRNAITKLRAEFEPSELAWIKRYVSENPKQGVSRVLLSGQKVGDKTIKNLRTLYEKAMKSGKGIPESPPIVTNPTTATELGSGGEFEKFLNEAERSL
jgi:hypothetical protein